MPLGRRSERPGNACSVPASRCLVLSKCSLRDARAPADFQTSVVGEEAEQWEGQTYWGDVSGQGAGGWA